MHFLEGAADCKRRTHHPSKFNLIVGKLDRLDEFAKKKKKKEEEEEEEKGEEEYYYLVAISYPLKSSYNLTLAGIKVSCTPSFFLLRAPILPSAWLGFGAFVSSGVSPFCSSSQHRFSEVGGFPIGILVLPKGVSQL